MIECNEPPRLTKCPTFSQFVSRSISIASFNSISKIITHPVSVIIEETKIVLILSRPVEIRGL